MCYRATQFATYYINYKKIDKMATKNKKFPQKIVFNPQIINQHEAKECCCFYGRKDLLKMNMIFFLIQMVN